MPDENIEHPPRGYTTRDTPQVPPSKPKRHWKLKSILAAVILLPIVAVALWTVIALNYTYSHGERAGYVQKFSKKGWLCKTWEGEMPLVIPNQTQVMPEIFRFTVRNDSIAQLINDNVGKRMTLSYAQHVGLPTSCFGDTEYFVGHMQIIGTQ